MRATTRSSKDFLIGRWMHLNCQVIIGKRFLGTRLQHCIILILISVSMWMKKYDIIFTEQVFEHLKYPYRAARNVWRMLKPGGLFIITTPFLVKIHGHPLDCTRWTSMGMKYFLEEAGFDPEATITESWGNRDCVVANFDRWITFSPGMSLENEADFPVVVWALARKPTA